MKVKLKNIRTQYTRERQKMKKKPPTGTGVADMYTCKWVHFKSLHFLDDFVAPRGTQTNMKVKHFTLNINVTKSCCFAKKQHHPWM